MGHSRGSVIDHFNGFEHTAEIRYFGLEPHIRIDHAAGSRGRSCHGDRLFLFQSETPVLLRLHISSRRAVVERRAGVERKAADVVERVRAV